MLKVTLSEVIALCFGTSMAISFRLCTYLILSATGTRMFRPGSRILWNRPMRSTTQALETELRIGASRIRIIWSSNKTYLLLRHKHNTHVYRGWGLSPPRLWRNPWAGEQEILLQVGIFTGSYYTLWCLTISAQTWNKLGTILLFKRNLDISQYVCRFTVKY